MITRLLSIVRAVLNGENLSVGIDEELLSVAQFHSLAPFLYPCMDRAQTDKEVASRVTGIYFNAVKRDAVQQMERSAVEADLEKENIPYLPLKGMIMKSLYPQPHFRTMGDLDFLVRMGDFKTAKKIIIEHGYKPAINAEHHLEFEKPPIMIIELHKMLIADKGLGREFFKNVLSRCTVVSGTKCRLQMSDEDFYVHLMLHLINHYINGGTGLRSFMDIYLYLKAKPDLNRNYINNAFAQTDYFKTIEFVERFSVDLYSGNPLDKEEQQALERIIKSGTYGIISNKSEEELKNNNNSVTRVVLRKLFPTVQAMKGWYPILGKGAGILLLPLFYCWHVLTRLFKFRKSMARVRALRRTKKQNKK